MEKFTFLQYIKMRIEKHGDRPNTKPSHDLIFDMSRDMENIEKCKDGSGIYSHIAWRACDECVITLKEMVKCYRQYCKEHNLECEHVRTKLHMDFVDDECSHCQHHEMLMVDSDLSASSCKLHNTWCSLVMNCDKKKQEKK